jgi:uncharacterized membrane protein (UPF0136 family)
MNKFTGITVALVAGALIGSAIGWVSCYLLITNRLVSDRVQQQVAQAEEHKDFRSTSKQQEPQILEAREIRLIGEDGKLCMMIRVSSGMNADYISKNDALIYFYDTNGKVSHLMGTHDGSFLLASKAADGSDAWGIHEPETTFYAEAHRTKK